MCQHQAVQTHWYRARENREYVRQLLTERQPELRSHPLQTTRAAIPDVWASARPWPWPTVWYGLIIVV